MTVSNQGTAEFYLPESRQSFLKKVQAGLAQRKIMVIEGPTGIGKTVVLEEVLTQTLPDANKCYVTPAKGMSDIQMRSRIIEQLFGNVLFDPEMPMLTSFIEFSQPQQILIAIDNCQFLSGRIIGELLQLASEANNLGLDLTVALALDKSLNATLLNVNSRLVKVMAVPRLNKQESYQLMVEYIADIPAQTNGKVKRWIDNAAGLPIQLLAYGQPQSQLEMQEDAPLNIKFWGWLLVLASLVLALGVYIYRKGLESPVVDAPTNPSTMLEVEPNPSSTSVVKEWQGSAKQETDEPENQAEFSFEEKPMAQVTAIPTANSETILADILGETSQPEQSTKPVAVKQVEQNPTTELILSELSQDRQDIKQNESEQNEPEQLPQEAAEPNLVSSATESLAASPSYPTYFIDNQKFMSLPANRFVLQLTAVSDEVVLSEYLLSAPVPVEALRIYQIKHKSKDWIVVTYGLFETIEQARQTAKEIEPNAWAKSVSVIQQQILAFQKAQQQ